MNAHRYILEPYNGMNTRYDCPGCRKRRTFVRYIDIETGEHLAPTVGRCNRESNCSYHYTPKQFFNDNDYSGVHTVHRVHTLNKVNTVNKHERIKPSLIPFDLFRASIESQSQNNFITYLRTLFDTETVNKLISRYYIGTSDHWTGATVFYQIDYSGKVRAGKVMVYNPSTGKRIKEPFKYITWMHKILKLVNFNLKQCFFGEHLLKSEPTKPIAIVESEKTAIIASVYLPKFIWIAAGSKDGLNLEKCSILKGRQVFLFPDLNGFEKWTEKAKEFSQITRFTVSDLLERKATEAERAQGLDLADYLIRFDYRDFQQPNEPEPEQWNSEDFDGVDISALTGQLVDMSERGTRLPDEVLQSFTTVINLRNNQNSDFRKNLNLLVQFISLN